MKHIHILSPSGAIDPVYIDQAQTFLQAQGFAVSVSPHAKGRYGRFSGTLQERLQDLNAALADPSIDFILCSRGGYGLAQILDKVQVPSAPCPVVIGFSDITCLHALFNRLSLPSLHALMTKHLSTLPPTHPALIHWLDAVTGKNFHYALPPEPFNKLGKAKGKVVGGNLSVLYGLQGTPFAPDFTDSILLLEDVGEREYHLDRMLQNLRLSGVFDRIKGLLVGQFTDCEPDPTMGSSFQERLLEMTQAYTFPIVFNFPVGHCERNFPVWLNTTAELEVSPSGTIFVQQNPINLY